MNFKKDFIIKNLCLKLLKNFKIIILTMINLFATSINKKNLNFKLTYLQYILNISESKLHTKTQNQNDLKIENFEKFIKLNKNPFKYYNTKSTRERQENYFLRKFTRKNHVNNEKPIKEKLTKKYEKELNIKNTTDSNSPVNNINFNQIQFKDIEKIDISNKFEISITNKNFIKNYEKSFRDSNTTFIDIIEKVAGRIISIRTLGKNLTFATISSNGDDLQIVFDNNKINESSLKNLENLKRGFIIGVEGYPYKTKTGEISLLAENLNILSICNYELPDTKRKDKQILTNFELRYEKRFLDLIVNNKNKEYYILRSKIISFLRNYLENEGYLEAETPILSKKAGGALAVPFETYSEAIKSKLYLRIAPELYLKKLIIGGYEKVFEIGKNFRNESISIRHNPEFTSCELYKAYADYYYMIDFTKKFLKDLCLHLYNRTFIELDSFDLNSNFCEKREKRKINFDEEYKIYDVNKELEIYFNTNLSNIIEKELYYNKMENLYKDLLNTNNDFNKKISVNERNLSLKKKIDKMIEYVIEPKCIQPSFIINHPILLSPLAKAHEENKNIAERFEFFINKIELINSYSELNNSEEQKLRFKEQSNLKNDNAFDDEIHPTDEDFLEALAYGMPPTAGWGLGIDRLCMLFLGLNNIKEVIFFPLMNVDRNKKNISK